MRGVLSAIALLSALLVPLQGAHERADAAITGVDIVLGPGGIVTGEASMTITPDTVIWQNDSGGPLSITSPSGVLDSGTIPDGGAYMARLEHPGTYPWVSAVASGTITVGFGFGGDEFLPAIEEIPDLAFPPRPSGDVAPHPTTTALASRSRILVGFTDEATSEDARLALARARVDVVGGLPNLGVVLAQTERTGFTLVQQALDEIRQQPGIAFATAEFVVSDATVPAPSADVAGDPFSWFWDSTEDAPYGRSANWTFESSRVPAAWNLNEAIAARTGEPVDVAVVDSGFEPHEDLSRLEILKLCRTGFQIVNNDIVIENCTSDEPSDHGNHVAGIVGADHDNRTADGRSVGVTGVDPFSDLYGVNRVWESLVTTDVAGIEGSLPQTFEELLTAAKDGRVPNLRIVNSSNRLLGVDFATAWNERWAGESCGPGPDDDDAGTGPCLPHTQDDTIREHAAYGMLGRRIVERFVSELATPPLFFAAAGNGSSSLCAPLGTTCLPEDRQVLPATIESSLAWASANWRPEAGFNPIVVVESVGDFENSSLTPSPRRSGFSDVGGDISAPGLALSTDTSEAGAGGVGCETGDANSYCFLVGTSQAAPFVAGAAGLLLAWDPTLTPQQLKGLLLDWRIHDTLDGAAPRLDAYRPLMALAGATRAIVDVNDPSPDGNRRLIRAADGTTSLDTVESTDPDGHTERDGLVDMRDFRRFRDAWLAECLLDGDGGCPDEIVLDGPVDHPKRDLNQDGCVGWVAPAAGQTCPSETVFNRFDFNGDGIVSRRATAPVGIRPDGAPAQDPSQAADMTDLEVLLTQWDEGSVGAEGVAAGDLDALLDSGDVELHLDGVESVGATQATVEVLDARTEPAPVLRTLVVPLDGNERIFTLPAHQPVSFRIGAEGTDASLSFQTPALELAAGEDRRLDACGSLTLDSDRTAVEPDGTANLTVAVTTCGPSPEGIDVDLGVTSTLTDAPTVAPQRVTTDAAGRASATFTAGADEGDVVVTATASVPTSPDGSTATIRSARVAIRVGSPYDLEVLALEGEADGSLWNLADPNALASGRIQPVRPSINGHGDVAFTANLIGTAHDDLFVVDGDASVDPRDASGAEQRSGSELDDGTSVEGHPQINDDGTAAVAWSRLDETSNVVEHEVRRYDAAGASDVIVTGEVHLTATSTAEPYTLLGHPSIANDGTVVLRATRSADDADVLLQSQITGVSEGPITPFARPWHADDGTTLTTALTDSGLTDPLGLPILDTLLLAGQGDHSAGRAVLARSGNSGTWAGIGSATISDTGGAVVFAGDRGAGPGLYVVLRDDSGAWLDPLGVVGADTASPGPELGTDASGAPLYLATVEGRPGMVHFERAPAGPAGDRLLFAFQGTPNAAGPNFEATLGTWTVAADVVADGAGFRLDLDRPSLVLQNGTALAGSTVDEHLLHDPIAADLTPVAADDHRLAIGVGLADGRMAIVRATWQGTPTTASSTSADVAAASTEVVAAPAPTVDTAETDTLSTDEVRSPAVVVADPSGVEVLEGPHVAALTLSSAELQGGDTFTVTNRSRLLDGTPVWSAYEPSFVENFSAAVDFDGVPASLAPDESMTLTLPSPRGTLWLRLGTPIGSSAWTSSLQVEVRVDRGPNGPPTAEAGGPYRVGSGVDLTLDPTGSTDPDGDTLQTAWDLDGDGITDIDGPFGGGPVDVPADRIEAEICGGACVPGDVHTVTLHVSDYQASDTDTAAVEIVDEQDFSVLVNPQLLKVQPGESGTAWLQIDPVNGFANTVDLSTEGVPDGWTVQMAPEAPPASYVGVRVFVPADETDGTFDIDIVGRSGSLEHRATLTVSTVFGLLPQCTASISGTAIDGTTGEPMAGSIVRLTRGHVTVAADGTWSRSEYLLAEGSEVERIEIDLREYGYTPFHAERLIECDSAVTVDIVVDPYDTGGVSGRVTEGVFNPVTEQRPIPTDEPIPDVTVTVQDSNGPYTTDVDGRFASLDDIVFGDPDELRSVSVSASADGYWPTRVFAQVRAGERVDLGDLGLLRQCTGTLGEAQVVDQFGDPVVGARVYYMDEGDRIEEVTDADGRVVYDDEHLLGMHNTERYIRLTALYPDDWPGFDSAFGDGIIEACNLRSVTRIVLPRPAELIPNYGTASGTVTDRETGEPIAGASVRVERRPVLGGAWSTIGFETTGADGTWRAEDVRVAEGDVTTALARIEVSASGYWTDQVEFTLEADAEKVVDADLLLQRFGAIQGTVRDAETGEPLEGVSTITGYDLTVLRDTTDGAGGYDFADLPTEPGTNGPRSYAVSSPGLFDPDTGERLYWGGAVGGFVRADETSTFDLDLLAKCPGGSVEGIVVNAQTLEPLEGALVSVGAIGSTLTDAEGFYRIEDIPIGEQNTANRVTVEASKEGFFEASKDVTVYCESAIVVDFGTPAGGFGSVVGTVTEAGTGDPIEGAFIGSSWGASTFTAADGTYTLDRAPLTSEGGDRTWEVVARHGLDDQRALVTVTADGPARQDFVFGAGNQAPVAEDLAVETVAGTPVALDLVASDPDGDPLTWTVTDGPEHGTVDGTAPTLIYRPEEGFTGADTIMFTVDDGIATSDPATVTIVVAEGQDRPPRIDVPAAIDVDAGATATIPVSAGDPDGDAIALSLVAGPSWAVLQDAGDGTGTVALSPPPATEPSTFDVTVRASAGGASVTGTIAVTVAAASSDPPTEPEPGPATPANTDPEAVVSAPEAVPEGSPIVLDATDSADPDGDELTFAWALADGRTFTGSVVEVPTDDDLATDATLTVSDGRGGSDRMSIPVAALNVAPSVAVDQVRVGDLPGFAPDVGDDPLPVEVLVGDPLGLTASFVDPGAADTHTARVVWGDGSTDTAPVADGLVVTEHAYAAGGAYTVAVEVCDDDGDCGMRTFEVLARAVIPPPDEDAGSEDGDDVGIEGEGVVGAPDPAPQDDPVAPPAPVEERQLPATGVDADLLLLLGLLSIGLGVLGLQTTPSRRKPG